MGARATARAACAVARVRHFAHIPQAHTPPFPFKVADVVLLGRMPYINRLAHITEKDRLIALYAMRLLGIEHIAEIACTTLSGGQQQLVLIARALTQQSDILVMDEPTAALDFGNQQLVLSACVRFPTWEKSWSWPRMTTTCAFLREPGCCHGSRRGAARGNTVAVHNVGNFGAYLRHASVRSGVDIEGGKRELVCIPLR